MVVGRHYAVQAGSTSPTSPGRNRTPRRSGLLSDHTRADGQAHGRVALQGQGGDAALLYDPLGYSSDVLQNGRIGRLATDLIRCLLTQRRVPPLGVRSALKRAFIGNQPLRRIQYPSWLNPDLECRLQLSARWAHVQDVMKVFEDGHRGPRAGACRSMNSPYAVAQLFEANDPGVTDCPVEVRYPFLDVRLFGYLLAVPSLPWCFRKELQRESLRQILPEAVGKDRKPPLVGVPS